MHRPHALAASAALFLLAPLAAQTWQEQQVPGPSPRYDHAMAWDAHRGRGVLFGGYEFGADRHFDDTWEYDGSGWSRPATSGPAPSPRKRHAMCFDSRRGVVVLFGGLFSNALNTNARYLGDTWEFDGSVWRQIQVAGPSPRVTDIAYDEARGVVVLVGGASRTGYYRDVWEYDGTSWTERGSTLLPDTRPGYEIAYDVGRAVTVIEPRFQYGQRGPWETHEWDGTSLRRAQYTTTGPHFPGGDLAYDARRGVVVAVGSFYVGPSQTWEYDGNDWRVTGETTGQESLAGHAIVSATNLGSLVLFGGEDARGLHLDPTDRTFEFAEFAQVTPFGTACSTTPRTPRLAPHSNSRPVSGTVFELELGHLQSGDSALVLIGLNTQTWAGIPLPFDLGAIGLPGCSLLTDIELARPVAPGRSFQLRIPAATSLHGGRLHFQALVSDAQLRPTGTSGGLTATVGR